MEKREIDEDGKEKSQIICDMCFNEIPKEHMKCCKDNRQNIQINTFDCSGNVKHYCRECSSLIQNYISRTTKNINTLQIFERFGKGSKK
jgi:hypothetical protein